MNTIQWLNIVNFGLVVLIWLVQLIIYPSLHRIDKALFTSWHKQYVRLISSVVVPLILAQMFLVLRALASYPSLPNICMLFAVLVCWAASFAFSVPCHKDLQTRGKNHAVIRSLVLTNWIRTIGWTCVFLTGILPWQSW